MQEHNVHVLVNDIRVTLNILFIALTPIHIPIDKMDIERGKLHIFDITKLMLFTMNITCNRMQIDICYHQVLVLLVSTNNIAWQTWHQT